MSVPSELREIDEANMENNVKKHFIAEWRQEKCLSQTELARLIDLTPSSISQIESGRTGYTQATLEKIGEALKVSPATLLSCNPLELVYEAEEDAKYQFLPEVENLLRSMSTIQRALALELLLAIKKNDELSQKWERIKNPPPKEGFALHRPVPDERFRMR
ncbi:transcriptional regulator with XRE-family HTH domain [Paenochrobactrum gallinarii]|uniref:Transcriptional regulator with XRE-family HTH domain n=1 Tax=Paenochrobactrum gallinarii TaxID=643673 RepID=A0A841M4G8_9HYPH|nr:helix-turn-helix transcriptional regulator [Paenochrobactrum gallinarii]MBB6262659.1 transcriptional regulator with XRE-family HTH domain [Paenochrobactrum gallinarii]